MARSQARGARASRRRWSACALLGGAACLAVPRGWRRSRCSRSRTIRCRSPTARLATSFDAPSRAQEIEAALAANDADLAKSFVEWRTIAALRLPPALLQAGRARRSTKANSDAQPPRASRSGLDHRRAERCAGLAGTALGDLFVFGDIRDAVREGSRYANGEKVRRAGARPCRRRHRHHRRHLCDASARGAGAGRASRWPRRRARPGGLSARSGRLDRPLAARGGRLVGAQARVAGVASPSRRSRCARRARRSRSRRPTA